MAAVPGPHFFHPPASHNEIVISPRKKVRTQVKDAAAVHRVARPEPPHNGGHGDTMWAHLCLCHVAIAIFFSYYNVLVIAEAVSEGQVPELLLLTECRDEC